MQIMESWSVTFCQFSAPDYSAGYQFQKVDVYARVKEEAMEPWNKHQPENFKLPRSWIFGLD
jgi:hypothetical protein